MFHTTSNVSPQDPSYPWDHWEGWVKDDCGGLKTPGSLKNPITGDIVRISHIMPPEYIPGLKSLVETFMATSFRPKPNDTRGWPVYNYYQSSSPPSSIAQRPSSEPSAQQLWNFIVNFTPPAPQQHTVSTQKGSDSSNKDSMEGTFDQLIRWLQEKNLIGNWEKFPLFPLEYDADTAHDKIKEVFNKRESGELPFIFRRSSSQQFIVVAHPDEKNPLYLSEYRCRILMDAEGNFYFKSYPEGAAIFTLDQLLETQHARYTPMNRAAIDKALSE